MAGKGLDGWAKVLMAVDKVDERERLGVILGGGWEV
jgi:hypothetical protein